MEALDFRLVNEFQRDFPLTPQPFAQIAQRLRVDEDTVLAALRRLHDEGIVSRVGAVLAPRRIGASTLAALAAPPERLEDIAARVSARPEVNHNYEREHRYNLWFVVTASDEAHLATTLAAIESDTGCKLISLPLEREFYIDLGFDLAGVCKAPHTLLSGQALAREQPSPPSLGRGPGGRSIAVRQVQTFEEQRLIGALQDGLELTPQPFARLGKQTGMSEQEVIATLHRWREEGLIKRFGVVVRHHELGYTANAMVVWDLPDDEVERVGQRLAAAPEVTLCYQRQRHPPEWTHNLFCMIHGRVRGEVEAAVGRLRERLGLMETSCAVLFSRRRFKQRGARYVPQAETAHG